MKRKLHIDWHWKTGVELSVATMFDQGDGAGNKRILYK